MKETGMTSSVRQVTYQHCGLQLTIGPSRNTAPEVWLQLDYVITEV